MQRKWWKEGVIYQVYPQSFSDSNGDGIGDLPGLISKLDYIRDLGVDIIWLNPIYDSPLDDNGYDIRDYRKINEIYGTMEDFDRLLAEAHARGLRIIMDLVVNHSSDEHAWFEESRKSKDNPYRDYYIWKPGKNGGPPTNWPSIFGGSAWEYDKVTDEYYLHYFTRKQPDLNWENPAVREEVADLMRWWLDKGIDGFRLDVISMISKFPEYADVDTDDMGTVFDLVYCNGPRVHEFIREIHDRTVADYDVMTVGEGPGITADLVNDYTGKDRRELNMVFPLDLMFVDWGPGGKFDYGHLDVRQIKQFFTRFDEAIGDDGWISVFLDNHDFARMVSRFGNDDEYRVESAKALLTMLLTLRGTPSIHYGSEIGMTNVKFDSIEDYKDVESLNWYRQAVAEGMPAKEAFKRLQTAGRDNVRTPMQWDATKNAGFSTVTPWLGVNPNHTEINVDNELQNPSGILNFFKKLTRYRKSVPAIVYGSYKDLDPDHETVFAYERKLDNVRYRVMINLSDTPAIYTLPGPDWMCQIHNYSDLPDQGALRPWEACVFRFDAGSRA